MLFIQWSIIGKSFERPYFIKHDILAFGVGPYSQFVGLSWLEKHVWWLKEVGVTLAIMLEAEAYVSIQWGVVQYCDGLHVFWVLSFSISVFNQENVVFLKLLFYALIDTNTKYKDGYAIEYVICRYIT